MRLLTDPRRVEDALRSSAVWSRVADAIAKAPGETRGVCRSVDDCLTYVVDTAQALASTALVARRRYRTVYACLSGQVAVRVRPVPGADRVAHYDDTTDRQVVGPGDDVEVVALRPGDLLVIDVGQASAVGPGDGVLVEVHVTVEEPLFVQT